MAKKDLMHSDAIKSLVRNAYLAVLDDKTEMVQLQLGGAGSEFSGNFVDGDVVAA